MIPKFSTTSISNIQFLVEYALGNEACLLDDSFTINWPAVQLWRMHNDKINIDYLNEQFGDEEVPVLVRENACEYTKMKFREFTNFINAEKCATAYLKDWHFQSAFPNLNMYNLPVFLATDWINNEEWTHAKNNFNGGDYRFVYFGVAGSWTKFHSDVMNSFSWSANICGRKLWYLLRRGAESHFSVGGGNFADDIRKMRDRWREAGVMEFVQEAGEIMFVPSGWYHQVHNLEDSISINHNVINALNVDLLCELVIGRLRDVEREIEDVRSILSPREFSDQCQKILLADCRMNVPILLEFMDLICRARSNQPCLDEIEFKQYEKFTDLEKPSKCALNELANLLRASCKCKSVESWCENCSKFLSTFEIERASRVKSSIMEFVIK